MKLTKLLLLLSLASSTALAADAPLKNMITGTLDAGDRIIPPTFKCKYGDTDATFKADEFKVRYKLWSLVGEPVGMFEFKYHLVKEVQIGVVGQLLTIVPTSDAATSLVTNGTPILSVPVSLFERIRLSSDFSFRLYHRPAGGEDHIALHQWHQGILNGQSKWGWDVPGSPAWDKIFVTDASGLNFNWPGWKYLNTAEAKTCWKTMCDRGPEYWDELWVTDLKLDLMDFLAELEKVNPAAASLLNGITSQQNVAKTDPHVEGVLRLAAVRIAMALDAGKPITDEARTAATQAAERAMKDSPRAKAMAENLTAVLKLFPKTDGFVNSLGMKFVPVPGTKVLFSIWDTRVQDFEAFVAATGYDATGDMYSIRNGKHEQNGDTWKNPGFSQGPTHPVVGVSWNDAKAFCNWLSRKEGKTYRLPTDAEWSAAIGLKVEHGNTPYDKQVKIKNVYPWGTSWPPPSGAGNYDKSLNVDNYEYTSPVAGFAANRYGLYDMGGNIWQWCEDWYDGDRKQRVSRGQAWDSDGDDYAVYMLSSYRNFSPPNYRGSNDGFRCVLETDGSP